MLVRPVIVPLSPLIVTVLVPLVATKSFEVALSFVISVLPSPNLIEPLFVKSIFSSRLTIFSVPLDSTFILFLPFTSETLLFRLFVILFSSVLLAKVLSL